VREGAKRHPRLIIGEHVGLERNMGKPGEVNGTRACVIKDKFFRSIFKEYYTSRICICYILLSVQVQI
jgi:hypothetical protein